MATNYPSGLDTYTNPAGTDALSTGHASQHANVNDAVEAIEAELGTTPSGSAATVKARFEAIETNDWVTTARIADSQVTSAKIANATITGSDIASETITSANILDDTIVNADINASAAIVGTKLADGAITPIKTSGGYVAKTALYTATNDDRVIDCTSGTYTVTLPTAASQTGRTFIIRNSGTGTITIGRTGAETIAGATSQTLAGYGQLEVISNGTNWLVVRGSYADETVGRRIFTWNSAYSSGTGGWQMTFGDTGWRDVSAGLESGTTGEWRMRRVNSTVTHHVYNVTNSSGVMYTIPAGFRSASYGTVIPLTKWDLTAGAVLLNSPATGNCTLSDGLKGYTGAYYMFTHDTSEAWPTSLPGSAVGSIPA